jgi:hypothetical protein
VVRDAAQVRSVTSRGLISAKVNHAMKSSSLLGFLESVPEVAAKLKEPETKERKFEEVETTKWMLVSRLEAGSLVT